MIDTHCHLDHLDDPAAGVDPSLAALVSVGTEPERNRRTLELAERWPTVWAAVGVHPNRASLAADPAVRAAVEAQAEHPRVVAVGETGFDTYWRDETLESQRAAFDWHAALARRLDLPLILHVRDRDGGEDASLAAVAALRGAGWERGVLHCCNAHPDLLEVGLDLGWRVSFAGNVTYKSATRLREAAASVPHDRLLVETDSPFLAPVPKRGERNVPANVRYTARSLADTLGVDAEAFEATLDANARAFYRLP